jgi:hypothetical protein
VLLHRIPIYYNDRSRTDRSCDVKWTPEQKTTGVADIAASLRYKHTMLSSRGARRYESIVNNNHMSQLDFN